MRHFPGQREGEEVIIVIRKHSIVYIKIISAFFLMFILPTILCLYIWFMLYPLGEYYQRGMIVGIFLSLYLLYGLLFVSIRWINEAFDVFILTTDRLIDITQISFLNRSVSSTPLEQIQDVKGVVNGFFPTIFRYGDITLQTAGAVSEFAMDHVHDPETIARRILDLTHEKREGQKIA